MLTRNELADLAIASSLLAKIIVSVKERGAKPGATHRRLYIQMTKSERVWRRLNNAKSELLSAYREECNEQ